MLRLLLILSCLVLFSCSSHDPLDGEENVDYVYRGAPAVVPPGAVRYCWEEPVVEFNQEGPGVSGEGTWYRPAAIIGRQVRQGRWRPCQPYPDETKGDTK